MDQNFLKISPFRQRTGYCGPSSLKMVLGYFGIVLTEHRLARMSNCSKAYGLSAEKMADVARGLGLHAHVVDGAEYEDIRRYVLKKKVPVIVYWLSGEEGHYSVVAGIDRENIYLQDPEIGHLRSFRLSSFRKLWFGFARDVPSRGNLAVRRIIIIHPH